MLAKRKEQKKNERFFKGIKTGTKNEKNNKKSINKSLSENEY